MKVLAVLNRKGGAGKTTAAVNLAGALAELGKDVLLVDADEQGAATMWSQATPEGLGFDVVHLASRSLARRVPVVGADRELVIIDGPAVSAEVNAAAIEAAHLVVVPVGPSGLDLWVVRDVAALILRAGRPGVFLLNRVNGRRRISTEAPEAFEALGLPVLDSSLGDRVHFVESPLAGQTVLRYAPKSEAALEVRVVAVELLGLLEGVEHDQET